MLRFAYILFQTSCAFVLGANFRSYPLFIAAWCLFGLLASTYFIWVSED